VGPVSGSLDGQVAVVTGSSRGIGRAIAFGLGRAGASVVANGRDDRAVEQVVHELVDEGIPASACAADVREEDAVRAMFEQARTTFGPVDVLVNNAGALAVVDAEKMALLDWERVLATNLTAPFLCAREAARQMLPRGRGVIVNISSIFAHGAMTQRAAYCVTKHGIEGLTRALAVEWGPRGIRVVAVSPSFVVTEQLTANPGIDLAAPTARSPLHRLAAPEDIADAVTFLAGPAASFINGSSIPIDGGWLADASW
jgi:NAD(P)-dependent dehydrogenase (short-subunit alcohol dehydrogenase family)